MKKIMPLIFAMTVLTVPCGSFAQQQEVTVNTTKTTETMGTVSELNPDTIIIQSETSSSPTNYSYTKSTTYVDDNGAPVSMEIVKSGLPVTVFYTQEGDKMVANKVVVRKTTTTSEAPGHELKKTSTTTTTTETKR